MKTRMLIQKYNKTVIRQPKKTTSLIITHYPTTKTLVTIHSVEIICTITFVSTPEHVFQ